MPDTVDMFHQLGYDIDTSKREKLSRWSMHQLNTKRWFRNHLRDNPILNKIVRKVARLFGVEFFS